MRYYYNSRLGVVELLFPEVVILMAAPAPRHGI